jgi:chemotaxis protein MotB
MSDEAEEDCNCPPPGLAAWMGTFADLMTLLMCFFVLLLSFAEMDAMKFKRLAGSMAQAFGVQNKLQVKDIPKGTSVIAQEFSPGRPEPTPINEIYQKTDDLTELSLEVECAAEFEVEAGAVDQQAGVQREMEVSEAVRQLIEETKADARDVAKALSEQIAKGEVEVETRGRQIIVRIREQGSFPSGSAELAPQYVEVFRDVRNILATKNGKVSVEGHTDDIPISTARFRSNWDLSSARAVSVAHELLQNGGMSPQRIEVSGFAETRPLASNETADGRATNRRVEIIVRQGWTQQVKNELQTLKEESPALYEELEQDIEDQPLFRLDTHEIF